MKNKLVMFKSSNTIFQFESDVKCISEIIIKDKKHYINVKLLNNEHALHNFDIFCKQLHQNFKTTLNYNNCIFTKLPFRYNRFSIQFDNLKTSEQFQEGQIFKCCIQFGGFVKIDQNLHACLKIIKVW